MLLGTWIGPWHTQLPSSQTSTGHHYDPHSEMGEAAGWRRLLGRQHHTCTLNPPTQAGLRSSSVLTCKGSLFLKGRTCTDNLTSSRLEREHGHGAKMVWGWQLFVAESTHLPCCSLSDGGLEKFSWIHLDSCPCLWCQRHSGHQANSCWTGAESRVNHSPWFVSCTHRGWGRAFFSSLLFLSIWLVPLLPFPPCSSYQGKQFDVPDAILLFGLETFYHALARKCADASQNGQHVSTQALEKAVVLHKVGQRSHGKPALILDFHPPLHHCEKMDFNCSNHLLYGILLWPLRRLRHRYFPALYDLYT